MKTPHGYYPEMGGARQRAAAARSRAASGYLIDGENVNAVQVAERLGISESLARDRLRKARSMPGPVTWDRLISLAPRR